MCLLQNLPRLPSTPPVCSLHPVCLTSHPVFSLDPTLEPQQKAVVSQCPTPLALPRLPCLRGETAHVPPRAGLWQHLFLERFSISWRLDTSSGAPSPTV